MTCCEFQCWSKMSSIKLKMTLILIVAVPYCLALITTVTIFALIEPVKTNGTKRTVRRDFTDEVREVTKTSDKKFRAKQSTKFIEPSIQTIDYPLDQPNSDNISLEIPFEKEEPSKGSWVLKNVSDIRPRTKRNGTHYSKYPFISAIIETLHMDSIKQARLICVGTNLNEQLVLTSRECFRENRQIKAQFTVKVGSNKWSSEQSSYTIKNMIYPTQDDVEEYVNIPKSPVLIILNEKLSQKNYADILNVNVSFFQNISLSTYFWKSSRIHPFKKNLHYDSVIQFDIFLSKCVHCFGKNHFCANIPVSDCSNRYGYSGYPLFLKDKLIGIQVSSYCHHNTKEVCFAPISKYYDWIKNMKALYGENDIRNIEIADTNLTNALYTMKQADSDTFFQNIKRLASYNSSTEKQDKSVIKFVEDDSENKEILEVIYKSPNLIHIFEELESNEEDISDIFQTTTKTEEELSTLDEIHNNERQSSILEDVSTNPSYFREISQDGEITLTSNKRKKLENFKPEDEEFSYTNQTITENSFTYNVDSYLKKEFTATASTINTKNTAEFYLNGTASYEKKKKHTKFVYDIEGIKATTNMNDSIQSKNSRDTSNTTVKKSSSISTPLPSIEKNRTTSQKYKVPTKVSTPVVVKNNSYYKKIFGDYLSISTESMIHLKKETVLMDNISSTDKIVVNYVTSGTVSAQKKVKLLSTTVELNSRIFFTKAKKGSSTNGLKLVPNFDKGRMMDSERSKIELISIAVNESLEQTTSNSSIVRRNPSEEMSKLLKIFKSRRL